MTLRNHNEEVVKEVEEKIDTIIRDLSAAFKKHGLKHDKASSGSTLRRQFTTFNDEYVPIEVRAEMPSRSYAAPTGKVRIQVGGYGDRTQFPERKAGFDYEAIVANIQQRIQRIHANRDQNKVQEKRRDELDAAVGRVNKKVGSLPGTRCTRGQYLHGIDIEIGSLTEEKALAVMQALKEILGT